MRRVALPDRAGLKARDLGLILVLFLTLLLPVETLAQSSASKRSGEMLGVLKRDKDGNITVKRRTGGGGLAAPSHGHSHGRPQPSQRGKNKKAHKSNNFLPQIAAQGFIHKIEAARYRKKVQDLMHRAERNRLAGAPVNGIGLTNQQMQLLQWLRTRDREVRDHEMAHYRAGRPYTTRPKYEFVTGPDGKRYAISGHVRFQLKFDRNNYAEALSMLRRLRTAALAPRQPSARDRQVADALAITIRQWQARRR